MTKFLPYLGGSHINGRSVGLVESMFRASLRAQAGCAVPEDVKLVRVNLMPREKLSEDELKAISWDDDAPMQFDENGKEVESDK